MYTSVPICSSIHILSLNCRVLLSRDWRGEVSNRCLRCLLDVLASNLDQGVSTPIVTDSSCEFRLLFVEHNDVLVACTTRTTSNMMAAFTLLHRLITTFTTYFDVFVEESVRDNFVIIYELLDEVIDGGYPQLTESNVLAEFIKVAAYRYEIPSLPSSATDSLSWRKSGISYKKNEIFLDVIEKCTLIVDSNGKETNSSLVGTMVVRSQLSGMPTCQLSLNKYAQFMALNNSDELCAGTHECASALEDVTFHPCVDIDSFRTKQLVCFTPPDGKFVLMTYRTLHPAKPLVQIDATVVSPSPSRIDCVVNLSTLFKEQTMASVIRVEIPVTSDTTSPKIQCSYGNVVYAPENNTLVWSMKNVKGKSEFKLRAKMCLPSTVDSSKLTANVPVRVTFEIPYNTASGVQVKYLKVLEQDGYNALPWVRYITRSDDYEFRLKKLAQ